MPQNIEFSSSKNRGGKILDSLSKNGYSNWATLQKKGKTIVVPNLPAGIGPFYLKCILKRRIFYLEFSDTKLAKWGKILNSCPSENSRFNLSHISLKFASQNFWPRFEVRPPNEHSVHGSISYFFIRFYKKMKRA